MDVNNYASKGVAGAGLGTGIAGLSLGVLNAMGNGGLLNGLFGGCGRGYGGGYGGCGDSAVINRYELGLEQSNAAKDSKIALLESTIHTNDKSLEVYGYVDGRLRAIESQICQQAVVNAQVTANIGCMQSAISGLQALTKTVVPITNICPEPMPLYNSWTAPTTTTTP
jgi:hypothetical protein